ncbi:MAG: alpha/beta fold hydrolase [Chloroflexi bacterium]|nr:alpha/beta fold hydrolase [Chloroflexota bacterium]
MTIQLKRIGILLFILLAACSVSTEPAAVEETAVPLRPIPTATTPATETAVRPTPTDEPEPTAIPPTDTPTDTPEPTVEEVEAETEEVEKETADATTQDVTIPGADGLEIQGILWLPGDNESIPGVILLHMLGSNRGSWQPSRLPDLLSENGYAVLAIDMRGHGETGGSPDWTLVEEDLQLVHEYFAGLNEVDKGATAVVGASIGGNMALIAGANLPAINAVVLLSPGLDYRGVTTEDHIEEYGSRPIFIAASEEDSYAADSSRTLQELAQGKAELTLYNGAGHGTNMFSSQPELAEAILAWLNTHVQH